MNNPADDGHKGTSKGKSRQKRIKKAEVVQKNEPRNKLKMDVDIETLSKQEKVERLCQSLKIGKFGVSMKMLDFNTDVNEYIDGKCPMYFALYNQTCNLDFVKIILSKGFPADGIIDKESKITTLHGAVYSNKLSFVKYLLEHPIDINVKDSLGLTPLHTAVKIQNLEMVRLLVQKGADTNIKCSINMYTPLFYAICVQNFEIVKLLLSLGAEVNYFCRHGRDSLSPLHIASGLCNLKIVQLLLENGGNVNSISPESKETPLHFAAGVNFKNPRDKIACGCIVQLLIQSGSDPTAVDESDLTPLHIAASRNNFHIVNLLIGIDSSPLNTNFAFHELMKSNEKSLIEMSIEYGADLFLKDLDGRYPVTVFIKSRIHRFSSDHPSMKTKDIIHIIKLIWACGFPVNLTIPKNVEWSKPSNPPFLDILNKLVVNQNTLYQGIKSLNLKLIRQALNRGATAVSCNQKFKSPLHYVASMGNKKIAEIILAEHKKINVLNEKGQTPLHVSAENGHFECCVLLLENGAVYNAASKKCPETPLELAKKKKHTEVIKLLEKINHVFQCLMKKEKLAKLDPFKAVVNCKHIRGNTLLETALLMGLSSQSERILKKKLKFEK